MAGAFLHPPHSSIVALGYDRTAFYFILCSLPYLNQLFIFLLVLIIPTPSNLSSIVIMSQLLRVLTFPLLLEFPNLLNPNCAEVHMLW